MRNLLTILLLFFASHSFAQTADAGADKTVYLTVGNSTTIGGSSSGSSYAWTKIYDVRPVQASYQTDPSTIVSPTSAATSVTGLIQGTWYYQLAATTGGTTKLDTVVIRVNYDVDPVGATLVKTFGFAAPPMANFLNDRTDTTQNTTSYGKVFNNGYQNYFDQARSTQMIVDSSRGKFYATVEDGYYWQPNPSYERTEVAYGSGYALDSVHQYMFEWKGNFPQDLSYVTVNQAVLVIWQLHGNDPNSPAFEVDLLNGTDGMNTHNGTAGVKALYFVDNDHVDPLLSNHTYWYLISLDSITNKTHTIRISMKEGAGPGAYIKVEVDGVQKYYRNTGTIGRNSINALGDYAKFSGIYDFANALVSPSNHSRNRKASVETQSFKIYQLSTAQGLQIKTSPIKKIYINH